VKKLFAVSIYILIGFLLGGLVLLLNHSFQGKPITLQPSSTPKPISVYIAGAIQNPGVYQLIPQARLDSLVELAGGLNTSADQSQINLAAVLYDGQHVVIPDLHKSETPLPVDQLHPLNINIATVSELDLLPGIGESKAQAIVAYRDQNGPFSKSEDIMFVPGIGEALFSQIKPFISVSDIIP
jgi:competence protein ComEA